MEHITKSEQQTVDTAATWAKTLKPGDIIFLRGNLGAGKSVFARSLVRALVDDQALEVPSPTFTLVQTYDAPSGPIWHFDLYRLKKPEEIYELGWEDAIGEALMIIEWPERLGMLAPQHHIDIHIQSIENEPDSRMIHINHIG